MSRELWNSTSLSFYTYISLHNFVRLILSFWSFLFALPLLGAALFSAHSHTHRCYALFIWNIKLSWIGCMQFWIFSAFTPHSLCCCERLFFSSHSTRFLNILWFMFILCRFFMYFYYIVGVYWYYVVWSTFFFFSFHPKNHNNNKKVLHETTKCFGEGFFHSLVCFFYRRQI